MTEEDKAEVRRLADVRKALKAAVRQPARQTWAQLRDQVSDHLLTNRDAEQIRVEVGGLWVKLDGLALLTTLQVGGPDDVTPLALNVSDYLPWAVLEVAK